MNQYDPDEYYTPPDKEPESPLEVAIWTFFAVILIAVVLFKGCGR